MPIEIINGLYLGNKVDGHNVDFLMSRKINVIINTSNEVPFIKNNGDLEQIRIPISDKFMESEKEKYNNEYYYQLDSLCKLIDLKLKKNLNVLVHCKHGKYRSTCLVVAYLMYKTRIKLDTIYEIMMTKYPLVKLKNHLFEGALRLYERDIVK